MKEKKEFQGKWENFWYYYKYHVIAAVFAVIMIAVFIHDKMKQIEYDYKVAVVTDVNISEEQIDSLEKAFAERADDRNKDGEIHVQVSNYLIQKENASNPQIEMANQTKFMADVQSGESMIFIYSDAIYDAFKDQEVFDVPDGVQVKLSECKGNTEKELNDLNIGLRIFKGTPLEEKEELNAYYKDSQKLLQRFKEGK